jgi:hypothetical protein
MEYVIIVDLLRGTLAEDTDIFSGSFACTHAHVHSYQICFCVCVAWLLN